MVTRPDGNHDLTANEVEQVARMAAPKIINEFRDILDGQTRDLKQTFREHENDDTTAFKAGNDRMGKIENKLAWYAGAIAALTVVVPIVVEIVRYFLARK